MPDCFDRRTFHLLLTTRSRGLREMLFGHDAKAKDECDRAN
jgi:hypothetical protein